MLCWISKTVDCNCWVTYVAFQNNWIHKNALVPIDLLSVVGFGGGGPIC